jgi:hypothetical protein
MPGLSFEIDGKHVPVDDCSWVMWGPCGCPWGVTLAGLRGEPIAPTEEAAWKQFYDRKRERDKAQRDGARMELMTFARWKAEVCDRMKIGCSHGEVA